VEARSCASKFVHYFPSSHEKVIVIDDQWALVQSGNYSENSIPKNEQDGGDSLHFVPGNRDMGIAIQSPRLARFFKQVLTSDMQLELSAEAMQLAALLSESLPTMELFTLAPTEPPAQRFASQRFSPSKRIHVIPVLTPDNYMEVVPGFLASAERSIYIEEQYIRERH
jgi:phosphatidylserine/phosphatidylglycerophosphate/cardiolipin synthase-like enzyme